MIPYQNVVGRARQQQSPARGLLIAVLVIALLLAVAVPLYAHLQLTGATPAAGSRVSTPVEELRLRFSENVELPFSQVTVTGPAGEVELGRLSLAPDSANVIVAPLREGLRAGRYQVRWQAAGPDGHPIRGEYEFEVAEGPEAEPAAEQPEEAPAAPAEGPPAAGELGAQEEAASTDAGAASAGYVAVRWINFAALLAIIGAVTFRGAVLPTLARRRAESDPAFRADAARRGATVGLAGALLLLAAAALRLYLQSSTLGIPLHADRLQAILTGTSWGWGWLLQAGAAAVAVAAFAAARGGRSAAWAVAGFASAAAAFHPALSGHAVAAPRLTWLAVLADGLHVLGAGAWVGSLLLVMVAGVPAALRGGAGRAGDRVRSLVEAFSPVALASAGLVVVTGLFAAWLHLGGIAELWQSTYGRTLLLKLGLLLPLFALGAFNWRRVRPELGDAESVGRFRRSGSAELFAAALVVAATALLVATSPPENMEMAGGATVSDSPTSPAPP